MKEIYIDLAGCAVKMQLSKEVMVSERLQPFICKNIPSKVDIVLEVRECESLPQCPYEGCWEGLNYYVYCGEELYVFHANKVGETFFSVTCFQKNGNVLLLYLKEYESYFTGSSSLFNRIGAEQLLLQQNRLMMHASFVKYQDKGILFSGPSGMGKSTQAELWKRAAGASVINGDRAAVGLSEDGWKAWGIPYAGTSGIYCNDNAVVSAIVVLGQAKENKIRRLNESEAFRCLYPQITNHQWDDIFAQKVISLLSDMISAVPVYQLDCLPDESAVAMLQEVL